MQAKVRIDDTVIVLADPAPPDWRPISSYVHIYAQDVNATYRKALEAGAVLVQEPAKKQDEDKRGGVKDAGAPHGGSLQNSSSSPSMRSKGFTTNGLTTDCSGPPLKWNVSLLRFSLWGVS